MARSAPKSNDSPEFARALIGWHRHHGRHDLPWQGTRDPYRVWLSEIMLQQTQVATVIPYYERFLLRFPDVAALARAPQGDVLALWAGLGYYSRARMAHRCARIVVEEIGGAFPTCAAELAKLPGIGPSTAAAIASFCFRERAAILDGNVKRVLSRHAAIRQPIDDPAVIRQLQSIAGQRLPAASKMPAYTQAIMDLGATLCRRGKPDCGACPVAGSCQAHAQGIAAELPTRRPARKRPEREVHWLMVLENDHVHLEQRPPKGIWGGLLALPEFASRETLESALRSMEIPSRAHLRDMPAARHAFTHFTLSYTTWILQIPKGARWSARDNWRAHPLSSANALPLPSPVARLLGEITI